MSRFLLEVVEEFKSSNILEYDTENSFENNNGSFENMSGKNILRKYKIEKYNDLVTKITNAKEQRLAMEEMARQKAEKEPKFLRGKNRLNALITFDKPNNQLKWNEYVIPESKLIKETDDQKWLGKVILMLMQKNEGKIIERALKSVADHIDGFIILDTQSDDDSIDIMWDILVNQKKKRGKIYQCPFWDFGADRTILVQLGYGAGELLFLSDADYIFKKGEKAKDEFEWLRNLPKDKKDYCDEYHLFTHGPLSYSRPHIVRGDVLWCYHKRTHEYLSVSPFFDHSKLTRNKRHLEELLIDHIGDGQCKSDKAPRDAVMILMDIEEKEEDRSWFYLGNSLRGMNLFDWADECYSKHSELSIWNEELSCAADTRLFCLNNDPFNILCTTIQSMYDNPSRLETLHTSMMFLRNDSFMKWPLCTLISLVSHNTYPSDQHLFVGRDKHEYTFWLEAAKILIQNTMYLPLAFFFISQLNKKKSLDSNQRKEIDNFLLLFKQKEKLDLIKVTEQIQFCLLQKGLKCFKLQRWQEAFDFLVASCCEICDSNLVQFLHYDNLLDRNNNLDKEKENDKKENKNRNKKEIETMWLLWANQDFMAKNNKSFAFKFLQSTNNFTNINVNNNNVNIKKREEWKAVAFCALAKLGYHLQEIKYNNEFRRENQDSRHYLKWKMYRLVTAIFFYFEALKVVPNHATALMELVRLQVCQHPQISKLISLLLKIHVKSETQYSLNGDQLVQLHTPTNIHESTFSHVKVQENLTFFHRAKHTPTISCAFKPASLLNSPFQIPF